MSVESLEKRVEAEVLVSTEEGEYTETDATSQKQFSGKPPTSDCIVGEEAPSTVNKKPTGRKQVDDSMNHTRIVKRTMIEILGLASEDEPPKKRPGRPRSVTKKQNSESLTQGLRVSRNGSVRQTVPAKFRDL